MTIGLVQQHSGTWLYISKPLTLVAGVVLNVSPFAAWPSRSALFRQSRRSTNSVGYSWV